MTRIRVLVVEDSWTVRRRICDVLGSDPEIEVVGEAGDGREAIDLCREARPDVVTMDMILPVMSGLAATEYIMAHCPTPILVVSSSFNRGELFKTYDALAAGAVDVLEKPTGVEPEGEWEQKLLVHVKLVARIRVITHLRQRLPQLGRAAQPNIGVGERSAASAQRAAVLAIGASTGGPGAVVEVLSGLRPSFAYPILLVLHIAEPFGAAFAEWLDGQTSWPVAYPHDGDPLATAEGRIVMAPPGQHLLVRDGRLRLNTEPERHSCRPSIDVLFESLALEYGPSVAAALLTGMGRDGAEGLLAIRNAGGATIAQDEESSVVYGMPREAVRLGAAERVLPLRQIGPALGALMARKVEAQV
jgi:two-component system, chemotaxis family, protein-glutamate methylesterase/glutaminase